MAELIEVGPGSQVRATRDHDGIAEGTSGIVRLPRDPGHLRTLLRFARALNT